MCDKEKREREDEVTNSKGGPNKNHRNKHHPESIAKEMNNSSPQKDMPVPKNGNIITSSASQQPSNGPNSSSLKEGCFPNKKVVRYKECLKNHAASIGGNTTDGCGEFMPSAEEGTLEALKCSVCNCHRNFHRKVIDGEISHDYHPSPILSNPGNRLILGHHNGFIVSPQGCPANSLISSHQQMIVPCKNDAIFPSESDENNGGGIVATGAVEKLKKRFRTKFTEEQKEKMLSFAQEAGWKMQKLEESVVQQFCQEIGIKRRVLKVWMHNNKHNFVKKNVNTIS